jgi:hypothetical protein
MNQSATRFSTGRARSCSSTISAPRSFIERVSTAGLAPRDELRRRLYIRQFNSEPRIPALDQAQLTGAKPIAQDADYLAALARRLK